MTRSLRRLYPILIALLVSVWACIPQARIAAMSNGILPPTPPPWMADIILNSADPATGPQCSGALVGNGWVLTAAHCVPSLDPSHLRVLLGQRSLQTAAPGSAYAVQQVLPMPDFAIIDTAAVKEDKNDAALLELRGFPAARWTAVPLATQRATVLAPGAVALFGYGVTGWTPQNQPLGGGILRRSPDGAFHDAGLCGPLLCLHRAGRTIVMAGDSGGPWLRRISGQWQLVGVQDLITGASPSGPTTAEATPVLAGPVGAASLRQWVRTTARLPVERPGTIIDDPADHQSYLVGTDGYRTAITTARVRRCLLGHGSRVVILPRVLVGTIPQHVGVQAQCVATSPRLSG